MFAFVLDPFVTRLNAWGLRRAPAVIFSELLMAGKEKKFFSTFAFGDFVFRKEAFPQADIDRYIADQGRPGRVRAGFAYYRALLANETDLCKAQRFNEFVDVVGHVFERESVGQRRLRSSPGIRCDHGKLLRESGMILRQVRDDSK